MKLVLATVLSRWQMQLADNKPVQPVRKSALLAPAKGVQILGTRKRSQNQRVLETTSSSV